MNKCTQMIATNRFSKRYQKYLVLLFASILLLLFANSCYAFRCGTHLISEGDLALKVKKYCGEPDWIDRWYDKIVFAEDTNFEHALDYINERWTYNLGPQQFMRFIIIRSNRVIGIETGPRGFTMPKITLSCDTNSFSLGMSSIEVMSKCGEPDAKSRNYEAITRPILPGTKGQITIPVDEWVFNLGPQYFVRILTFRNGKLIDIKTGSRGF